MSQCPNCQKQIDLQEKHFGALYTCPQCQAVYFINFDGQPEYDPNPPDFNPEEFKQPADQTAEQVIELGTSSQVHSDSSTGASPIPSEEMEKIVLDSLSGHLEAPFEIPLESNFETPTEEPPTQTSAASKASKNPLQDIVDFANSNEASTAGIEYNLKISGIDSKDLLEAVKEALTDSRFMWDLEKILSEIKDGELVIKKISPVKASLVVSRLRFHDLEISWEQNAI